MHKAFKHLAFFGLCLTAGLWSAGFFERYVLNFSVEETFTKREADALIGKQVQQTHFNGTVTTGRIIGWKNDPDGQVRVQIKFDHLGKEITVGFPKLGFENHLRVIE